VTAHGLGYPVAPAHLPSEVAARLTAGEPSTISTPHPLLGMNGWIVSCNEAPNLMTDRSWTGSSESCRPTRDRRCAKSMRSPARSQRRPVGWHRGWPHQLSACRYLPCRRTRPVTDDLPGAAGPAATKRRRRAGHAANPAWAPASRDRPVVSSAASRPADQSAADVGPAIRTSTDRGSTPSAPQTCPRRRVRRPHPRAR
jgi:hypothetical protein